MLHTYFLDQGDFLGGAERFLLDFFHSLSPSDQKDLCPIVIGGNSPAYQKQIPHIPVHPFAYPSVGGNVLQKGIASIRLLHIAQKLKTKIQQTGPGTIFSNTPRTHFTMLLAKRVFGISGRWVAMFHDLTIPPLLLRQIAQTADVLIANGTPMRQQLRECICPADFGKIRIVENGIPFRTIPYPVLPKKIENILVLGRIDPRKGQMHALEAAKILQSEGTPVRFFFVGSAAPTDPRTVKYEAQTKSFAETHRLSAVHFLPETADPFAAIQKSDLVLFLPTEPETFGRVVIEGLALGKLVLSFDMTGPREILKSYETFLNDTSSQLRIPVGDSTALADRIRFFVQHPERIPFYTEQARPFVERQYSLEETKKRLMAILTT